MKRYRATDKHPFLKSGVCLNKGHEFFDYEIENGWIKELEEKEFTKSDMMDYGTYCIYSSIKDEQTNFDNWLKEREK